MTYRAEQIWEAFKGELIYRKPTEDMREALATAIRVVADRLCTDVGEIECPVEGAIIDQIEEAVMSQIYEYFTFDEEDYQ